MQFNPMFIKGESNSTGFMLSQPAKLKDNKYLFSNIIKVLSSQKLSESDNVKIDSSEKISLGNSIELKPIGKKEIKVNVEKHNSNNLLNILSLLPQEIRVTLSSKLQNITKEANVIIDEVELGKSQFEKSFKHLVDDIKSTLNTKSRNNLLINLKSGEAELNIKVDQQSEKIASKDTFLLNITAIKNSPELNKIIQEIDKSVITNYDNILNKLNSDVTQEFIKTYDENKIIKHTSSSKNVYGLNKLPKQFQIRESGKIDVSIYTFEDNSISENNDSLVVQNNERLNTAKLIFFKNDNEDSVIIKNQTSLINELKNVPNEQKFVSQNFSSQKYNRNLTKEVQSIKKQMLNYPKNNKSIKEEIVFDKDFSTPKFKSRGEIFNIVKNNARLTSNDLKFISTSSGKTAKVFDIDQKNHANIIENISSKKKDTKIAKEEVDYQKSEIKKPINTGQNNVEDKKQNVYKLNNATKPISKRINLKSTNSNTNVITKEKSKFSEVPDDKINGEITDSKKVLRVNPKSTENQHPITSVDEKNSKEKIAESKIEISKNNLSEEIPKVLNKTLSKDENQLKLEKTKEHFKAQQIKEESTGKEDAVKKNSTEPMLNKKPLSNKLTTEKIDINNSINGISKNSKDNELQKNDFMHIAPKVINKSQSKTDNTGHLNKNSENQNRTISNENNYEEKKIDLIAENKVKNQDHELQKAKQKNVNSKKSSTSKNHKFFEETEKTNIDRKVHTPIKSENNTKDYMVNNSTGLNRSIHPVKHKVINNQSMNNDNNYNESQQQNNSVSDTEVKANNNNKENKTSFENSINTNIKIKDHFDGKIGQKSIGTQQTEKVVRTQDLIKNLSEFIGKHEKNTLTISIDPKELGKLKITLESVENHIKAHIKVDSIAVKQIIENNLGDLFSNLSKSGVQLNSINITLNNSLDKKTKNEQEKKKVINVGNNSEDPNSENKDTVKMMGYNTYEYLI